ncbi:heat shock protein beta-11-like [Limulus polyphemus]|uniref:Heat shock protein beta-11-like n=1 Tax=Limulus polyphemus TaxID=6850 RepID=A0ABM1C3V1_LIMPO|nr:heat shock protein beta-11-like [Limulus polyphemus]
MSKMASRLVARVIPVWKCVPRLSHCSRRNVLHRCSSPGHIRHCSGRRWGEPFSELSSVIRSMERQIQEVDREMKRMFDEVDRASPIRFPRALQPWWWSRRRNVPVETAGDENRQYKLELDLSDFNPEEIKITVKDNLLTVQARQDVKKPDGSRFLREYNHEYTLPEEVNPEAVRSQLNPDGTLIIEAPLPAIELQQPKEIPVTKEHSQDNKKEEAS